MEILPGEVRLISVVEAFNRINPEVLNYAGQFSDGFLAIDCCDADTVELESVSVDPATEDDKPAKSRKTNEFDDIKARKIPGCLQLTNQSTPLQYDVGILGGPEKEDGWRTVLLFHSRDASEDRSDPLHVSDSTRKAIRSVMGLEVVDSAGDGGDAACEKASDRVILRPTIAAIFLVDKSRFLKAYPWFTYQDIQHVSFLNLDWRMPSVIPLKLDPSSGFQPIQPFVRTDENISKRSSPSSGVAHAMISTYSDAYINHRLFLCSRRAIATKNTFQFLGIDSVVDLSTNGGNVLGVEGGNYLRLEILDVVADDVTERLLHEIIPAALKFIRQKLAEGRKVAVHCDKGQSRSGAVVVAWEMMSRIRNMKLGSQEDDITRPAIEGSAELYEKALMSVRQYRSIVEPNVGFAMGMRELNSQILAKWEEFIFGN